MSMQMVREFHEDRSNGFPSPEYTQSEFSDMMEAIASASLKDMKAAGRALVSHIRPEEMDGFRHAFFNSHMLKNFSPELRKGVSEGLIQAASGWSGNHGTDAAILLAADIRSHTVADSVSRDELTRSMSRLVASGLLPHEAGKSELLVMTGAAFLLQEGRIKPGILPDTYMVSSPDASRRVTKNMSGEITGAEIRNPWTGDYSSWTQPGHLAERREAVSTVTSGFDNDATVRIKFGKGVHLPGSERPTDDTVNNRTYGH